MENAPTFIKPPPCKRRSNDRVKYSVTGIGHGFPTTVSPAVDVCYVYTDVELGERMTGIDLQA